MSGKLIKIEITVDKMRNTEYNNYYYLIAKKKIEKNCRRYGQLLILEDSQGKHKIV